MLDVYPMIKMCYLVWFNTPSLNSVQPSFTTVHEGAANKNSLVVSLCNFQICWGFLFIFVQNDVLFHILRNVCMGKKMVFCKTLFWGSRAVAIFGSISHTMGSFKHKMTFISITITLDHQKTW